MITNQKFKYSREEKFFIFYFPLLNILLYSIVNFIPRQYNADIIRGLLSFIVIFYFLRRGLVLDKPGQILLIFTAHVSIMSFLTYYNFGYLDNTVFKVITASFFYFFGIFYIREYKHFILMLKSLHYGLILVLLSMLVSNLFNIGPRTYGMDIHLGAMGVNTTKILPILFFPLLLRVSSLRSNIRERSICYLIIVISIFTIPFGMKRGAVLGLSLAFITYLFFSGSKGKTIRILVSLSIFFALLSTIFWSQVERAYYTRYESYQVIQEERYEKEARYNEVITTLKNLSPDKPLRSLFGFGFKSEFSVYNVSRMYHTDYMSLLHGTGILGLFLYLWFYRLIFKKNIQKIPAGHQYYRLIKEIQAINIALIIYSLILAISGSIHVIELRGFMLLFFAGAMRFQYSLLKQGIKPVGSGTAL